MESDQGASAFHLAQDKLLLTRTLRARDRDVPNRPRAPEVSPALAPADLFKFVKKALHEEHKIRAAKEIAKASNLKVRTISESQADQILYSYLQWILEENRYGDAASLLWSEELFTLKPQSAQDIWKLYEESDTFLLMGAASMSKSYSVGVRLLLEWIRDPTYTTIKVIGPSETHLEDNLFSHLVELHRNSTIKLPGQIGSLFIGTDTKARRGSITGVVVPLGKGASGRLQGVKRFPRKKAHKKFGKLSRLIVFMDEMNKIPKGIWKDVDNVLANQSGDGGMKIGGAFNPQDENDEVGLRSEPEWGWGSFDVDQHFKWKSKRGWDVLRLDAERCENVIEGKEIFPGLQTRHGMEKIIKNAGGYNTPGYYSMVRAVYPPSGVTFSIIPQGMLHTARGEYLWVTAPKPCGGVDLALEGGDRAVLAKGEWGVARGIKYPPSLDHPEGHEELFKQDGAQVFRNALQVNNLYVFPRGDTVETADRLKDLARKLGIRPEWLCVDRTGNGAGVHDLLKKTWSLELKGVNFYESATTNKILIEDDKTPKEEFDRIIGEMWFGMKKFIEFDYLKFSLAVETDKIFPQLTKRLFRPGEKSKVESKKEYCSRGNESPNEADAVGLLILAVRKQSMAELSMHLSKDSISDEGDAPFCHVGITDRYEGDL